MNSAKFKWKRYHVVLNMESTCHCAIVILAELKGEYAIEHRYGLHHSIPFTVGNGERRYIVRRIFHPRLPVIFANNFILKGSVFECYFV